MIELSPAKWLVLDNLKNGWNYWTNLDRDLADKSYLQCVEDEFIKDGKITQAGLGALIACPNPK